MFTKNKDHILDIIVVKISPAFKTRDWIGSETPMLITPPTLMTTGLLTCPGTEPAVTVAPGGMTGGFTITGVAVGVVTTAVVDGKTGLLTTTTGIKRESRILLC